MVRIFASLISVYFLFGAEYNKIPLLRWAGPPGSRPGTYEEWIAQHPDTSFSYNLDKIVVGDSRQGTVVILTAQSIANALTNEINQLINNLQLEGYTVLNYQISGGTPETLRTFLQNLYNLNNIEGALFIGNLPVPWFQVKNDFDIYGYAEWPIDLFYMDLNGAWLDTLKYDPIDTLVPGQDSIYDVHSGDLNPEIFIGRLTPSGIGDDTLLLKNYFRKDNAYRYDTLEIQHRALIFCDDDWEYWAPFWAQDVSLLYSDTMNYWDPETTRASIYRVKLDTTEAWVSLFAHSWPGGHQFTYNSGGSYDYYWSTEYTTQDPPANFYNHFACSFARYTENGYGGGRSIFNQSYGLGEIGSTKTGSMLDFYYFYLPLSQENTLGKAFKDWFTYITSNGVTFDELCWHYGMTLLGDPFLKPTGHNLLIAEAENGINLKNLLNITGNPSRKEIIIQLNINKPSKVSINIYDCLGRKVKTLLKEQNIIKNQTIHCILTDEFGNLLPRGVYLISANIDNEGYIQKVIKF